MNGLILSIDTSCDDTSAAVVCGWEIWSNVIASQTDLHQPYGGVFPTVAKQAHKENIEPTVRLALRRAGVAMDQIDKIAVTIGPGLAPALEVGIEYAKQLAERYQLPLMPVNHIEGHVLSVLAKPRSKNSLPRHAELVSASAEDTRHPELTSDSEVTLNRQKRLELVSGSAILFQGPSGSRRQDFSTSRTESLGNKIAIIHSSLPALSIIVSGGHTQFVLVEPPKARHYKQDPESQNLFARHAIPTSEARSPKLVSGSGLVSASRTGSLGSKKAINHSAPNLFILTPDRQPRLSLAPDPLDPYRPWYHSGQFTYTILGQTLDDAAGECLDKVGRMLNLGYPAAPVMEQLAKLGNPTKFTFPLPLTTAKDYNLSFAGLKTHARRLIESETKNQPFTKQQIYDFCASFQTAVFRHITYKLSKVLVDYPQIQEVWLGGGVAANMALRKSIRQALRKFSRSLRVPYTKRLCQDNAGMGGVTAN